MGLDIVVLKPKKLSQEQIDKLNWDNGDFIIVKGDFDNTSSPELDVFKDFFFEKENEYYDLNSAMVKIGYKPDELQWVSSYCGNKDGNFIEIGDDPHMVYEFKNKKNEVVKLIDPPLIKIKDICLAVEEIGYQRKGANKSFYSDDMWDSAFVVDKQTLLTHWEKYFSGDGNINDEGAPQISGDKIILGAGVPYGYGVETSGGVEQNRENFKINIIDKFIEGENFVSYQ